MEKIAKHLNGGPMNKSILPSIIVALLGVICFLVSYEANRAIAAIDKSTAATIEITGTVSLIKNNQKHMIITVDDLKSRIEVVEQIQQIQGASIGHYPRKPK